MKPIAPNVCRSCGGSGVEAEFEQPSVKTWQAEQVQRWKRQLRNRPLILEGVDRYLSVDEEGRLGARMGLPDFIHECLNAMTDIAHGANQARALRYNERSPLVVDALDGMFVVAAEIVHYLADRGHPILLEDFLRIAKEQHDLREAEDAHNDPDPDPDPDIDLLG